MVRRRRKRVSSREFVLSKYKVGGGIMTVSFLYFFAYFLAQGSPMLEFINTGAFIAFGEIGTIPFFFLLAILGLLIIFKGHMIKLLIKQFILLQMFLSAVFNFAVIDTERMMQAAEATYHTNGGYISRPILWLMNEMFGATQTTAIKSLILILLGGVCVWLFYSLNVQEVLPSMPKITLPKDTSNNNNSRKQPTPSKSGGLGQGIAKNLHGLANQLQQKIENQLEESSKDTLFAQADEKSYKNNQAGTKKGSLLQNIFRSELQSEVKNKLYENTLKKIPFPEDKPTFSPSVMNISKEQDIRINKELLLAQANDVQTKLAEFNVPVTIDGFDIGPSIIQMRIKPEAGIKVSSIENLKNDIALSIKAGSLRIEAPIPGTDCVGIQLPNPQPQVVYLGDILTSPYFRQAMQQGSTNLALGKGIDGQIIIKSLEKMPHLLVAGATGSGKSVGVNDFILSLIFQNSPTELKFLMIDPKQVELEFYSGLPYLLAPIITQPDKALKLLQRSVQEMERRYDVLKTNKVKNLDEYNEKHKEEKLYRIVIVIDELADLMMTGNKKEVENCITRIAQKARAVGMHLIIATQRPSVNVLTGLIKANIPTRIAFGVVSQIDSRTILGMKGAEDLVGKGDMLYADPSIKTPIRIQAPFVTTEETEKIINSLKDRYMKGISPDDVYHPEIIHMLESKASYENSDFGGSGGGSGDEELIQDAMQVIAQTRKASATLLQRKLNVGFARAARIMDELEARGIVGPQDGAKPREVFL